ncbi:tRNA (N6-isopentenyl adenosine(37)-C2)-methylthiotransferase MiaB [Dokdonia donghaensis]|uniref:tRNA-2-methylthio-N(6)-dimethylallyladenosine synthase n=1 Tax=Dokdonia donghaensis DSW-1 TaxID=1300343 RepID=A0A0A2GVT1_9FLAO|nr:tRNA (N6-isopentenyl adenosine(37)-C2)-methylthiotransferase MiaB [Dokdonia donghaensis]ANH58968.1 (Dimethylallyl)adenosine tRNA methylthiotransferase MiaB [Dokdonia donghaensis DSW-1]KGO06401.1 (dimethylallyl)adenosine tRNA methylthiotransferase [Dokdonia donghaensis DSW-1]
MEKIIDEHKQGEALTLERKLENSKKLFIESYGCQMNFADSEVVASILANEGYNTTQNLEEADLVLVNTCSIREKAEVTVRKRLEKYQAVKRKQNPTMKVGVLGCMAERLKSKFLEEEKIVDLVVGPDAYKDIPNLLSEVEEGRDAVNVILSKEETYGDISPVRLQTNGVTAFVSITRGCDNMCTFCVVPFTRGRERSRDPQSILEEVEDLANRGFKEITLLGQNVDSYLWYGGGLKKDFDKASEMAKATAVNFAQLMDMVAKAQPKMRIRFSTSNPQDMTLDVIEVMASHKNICNYIHLPVQSGSDRILKLMNRQHTVAEYKTLIDNIKNLIPDIGISQDMITGFPTETEEDHQGTLDLIDYVKYDYGFMFYYSERPGTLAERKMEDDIPLEIKKRRLQDVIDLQREISRKNLLRYQDQIIEVLIEKESKKNKDEWSGRNDQNVVAVFPKGDYKVGDFVNVKVNECTTGTLIGEAVGYADYWYNNVD